MTADNGTAPTTALTRAWAEVDAGLLGCVSGDVVAFDGRLVLVACGPSGSEIPVGRAVWIVLGLDDEHSVRVAASVVDHRDAADRQCLVIELCDPTRQRKPRVPFRERVEVIGITDRPGPDPRWRGVAVDVSVEGLGAIVPTEIRAGGLVLLRFALPPHRAVFQVRAKVKSCARDSGGAYRVSFGFERVTAGHAQHLQSAIVHIATARRTLGEG